ncbi:hypothetical protein N0V93_008971 [Gnomoniopsis smithogilvyi]|uniref:Uncharacterized protein n=1 Tax=Gnomoniopsis smithogilvyi TaxID=1191159 RepID=A0A9W8YJT3_9PEZI|nr:hypothetical protein N0V93_008971 [Gnomoniopsis smithogilvyi]
MPTLHWKVLPLLALGIAIYLRSVVFEAMQVGSTKSRSYVTYKETSICETTPGVKSYSGYVSIPPTEQQPFPQHLFFWFFEARKDPHRAPMALWINGGPGGGSMDQVISTNGPCLTNADGNSTRLNDWSWNNEFNLIYIDTTIHAGFSYDVATSAVRDLVNSWIKPGDGDDIPERDRTKRKGVYSSNDIATGPNTTAAMAKTVSKFFQLWFDEFTQYRRENISIWSWSYGGYFVPAIAAALLDDKKIASEQRNPDHHFIGVDTIGIMNGLVDLSLQLPQLVKYPNENSYGIEIYNTSTLEELNAEAQECLAQSTECDRILEETQYDVWKGEPMPNICFAGAICWNSIADVFDTVARRNPFDLTHLMPDGFPQTSYITYLLQPWVRDHLGAKVDYVEVSVVVDLAFSMTCDPARSHKRTLERLLDAGVHVALLYGDADFRSDWVGGEALSLALEHRSAKSFRSAGYTPMTTNKTGKTGGYVRQSGGLSFIRVLDAGHLIPFFQPQVAYDIFMRASRGLDVATGTTPVNSDGENYVTSGPDSIWDVKVPVKPQAPEWCNPNYAPLWYVCTGNQIRALEDGTAVVKNGVVIEPLADLEDLYIPIPMDFGFLVNPE